MAKDAFRGELDAARVHAESGNFLMVESALKAAAGLARGMGEKEEVARIRRFAYGVLGRKMLANCEQVAKKAVAQFELLNIVETVDLAREYARKAGVPEPKMSAKLRAAVKRTYAILLRMDLGKGREWAAKGDWAMAGSYAKMAGKTLASLRKSGIFAKSEMEKFAREVEAIAKMAEEAAGKLQDRRGLALGGRAPWRAKTNK